MALSPHALRLKVLTMALTAVWRREWGENKDPLLARCLDNKWLKQVACIVVNVMESKINVESYGKRPVTRSLEAAKRIPGRWLNDDGRPRLRYASSRLHVYRIWL